MNKSSEEYQIEQSILNKGIKLIIYAFNNQKNEYTKNIDQLESEIKRLREENFIYKNKLSNLQKKLDSLSKTVCVVDSDNEEIKNQNDKGIRQYELYMKESLNKDLYNNNRTLTNNYNKKNEINNKINFYKKFFLQNKNFASFQEYPKNSKINPNNQRNLKYMIKSPLNSAYNKVLENIKYTKKANNNKHEKSFTQSSFTEKSQNKKVIEVIDESKTDRDFYKRKVFSEKNLEIHKKKHKKEDIIDRKILNDKIDDIYYYENKDINKSNKDIMRNIREKVNESQLNSKDNQTSGDNNSKLYQKLDIFLEESKKKLTAWDYENIVNLLKSFEINSNVDIRKKVKKILNNNHKLCKLFDNIFDS